MHFTWLLVLMITPLVIADSEQCRYERSNDMLKAFCNDSTYNLIPQDLNKTIMVLSVSNKDMNLDNKTFANYLRLEELYLQNNTIMKIHEDAFAPLQHLKILDLRHNRLTSVPYNIFVLPNLRVLDLSHNILYNESFESVEVTSPIESLSMAWNMITKMPSFKSLYKVTELNLNSNIISEIPIDNLASMCSLEKLSVSSLYYSKEDEKCECEKLKKSAHEWGIKVSPTPNCPISERCSNLTQLSNETLALRNNCLSSITPKSSKIINGPSRVTPVTEVEANSSVQVETVPEQRSSPILWICVAVAVIILLLCLVCCISLLLARYNVKGKRSRSQAYIVNND